MSDADARDAHDAPGPARPGNGKRVTMRDVAEAAGVSQPLVSIVMREAPGAGAETRARVLQAAARLGYRRDERARMLRQGRSLLIGIVFHAAQPFHGELIDELQLAARGAGYNVSLAAVTRHRGEADAIDALLGERVEGLVLLGATLPQDAVDRIAGEVAVVTVASQYGSTWFDSVSMDDARGTELAVRHLRAGGHTRILYLGAPGVSGDATRRATFLRCASEEGLDDEVAVLPGGASEADGARGIEAALRSHPDATAVIAFNDRSAQGIVAQARLLGKRVPEDLAVVGFDDSEQAELPYLQLTSLAQDPAQLASAAVEMVVRRAEARAEGSPPLPGEHRILPTELVVRRSSGGRTA
ncbi:LacI family transcriptional regulator [Pseudoclavibacter chungangensis]|uniref:LacI family transcriptional regulator n=1 Tax=Pseudoclavibacter chungangensis TaxID=587635 RepID=A0A7J5BME2_9MICO|nr:LacI family DNA-binding transcriptional regulator [Pseudoclavibacter chungangensis]KAB1652305.1 LacI family transcriptional regulator [Pseudoclavibacter chungangensis]NYJ66913.1 LacI family transcriptional regulator [Pseudoclavibacter chungangensis]